VVKEYLSVTEGRIKRVYKLLPPLLMRDIKERYAGSVMGIFWTFIQPLLFILLYWLVFARILKIRIQADMGEIPFFAFLLTGLLPWFALQEGVIRGASSIIEKRHVIKKVMFPAELFPLSSVISSFIHHSVGIIVFLLIFFLWKGSVSITQILFIIILLTMQISLTSGLSLIFSSLSVYIRDIIQIIGVGFQVAFYMSTILYPLKSVPADLKFIILLNPATSLTEAYHNVILFDRLPETGGMLYLSLVTVISVMGGVYLFKKLKRGFSDVL
jgi:ABC-type polysaccharide/polyol phosphate export permease